MMDSAPIFPIDLIKSRFISALKQGDLIVTAGTGSGKSTRLPLWAATLGKTLVVEPRRVACTALADFIAGQTGTETGARIGYAIRFQQKVSAETEITFVTPGVALRWLSEGKLDQYHTVILDEFHERRWDMDLLLALIRHGNRHRIVITSATIDSQALQQWSGAALLEVETQSYPVEVNHIATDPRQMPSQKDIAKQVAAAVSQQLSRRYAGDLLVFLPGRREISETAAILRRQGITVAELHGSVSNREQLAALQQADHQRVILATNIAETSLTIPGVTQVIDSGLERRTHQRNGRTVLALHPISLASADQRKGRAGRVAPGQCLRLWGEHAPLERVTPPEVVREELTDLVLAAACSGVAAAELNFPSELPQKSLQLAIAQLEDMRAIDARGLATDHGRRLFPLPIDTLFSHLITAMPDVQLRMAMIDLAAALSVGGRLLSLPRDEQKRQSLVKWQPLPCDGVSLIKLIRMGGPDDIEPPADLLAEARQLSRQMRQVMQLPACSATLDFRQRALADAIIQAQPALAYVRREKRPQAMGNGYSEVQIADYSRFDDDADAALVLDQYSLPGRGTRQTINKANCLMPVTFAQIAAAGLGEDADSSPQLAAGEVEVTRQRLYAGRCIDVQQIVPEGEMLHRALAELILRGRLLRGAGDRLLQDLAAWRLWNAIEGQSVEVPEALDWLQQQLSALGVETVAELQLFEAGDLVFDGIPQWQRDDFDSRYPQQLSLSDLKLSVEYDTRKKRITIEAVSGTRKQPPARWELPAWNGWKIQYRKASRVIDIR
ncbi:helicase-related protein [Marinobacterium jannaschii]|uniref:helicase-related protein n=1 Tax=Marinobacterium jannaschii TaxID=64970 RepID=UPI00048A11F4|nr:helicase-related protein [Marinobacterium jannaschii]